MNNNSQRCKKVKFKSDKSAQQNGSSINEQNHNSITTTQNCHSCSFPKFLLTFLLLLSFYTIETQSNVVDDLYRSRSKRYVEQGEDTPEVLISRPDTVCNQGGNHECVCNRSSGDMDDKLILCDRLLEEKHLMAVSLIMRNINLDIKLHTNEPYQQYLRRRIANIVSQYCEHQANECPGAILSLNRNNVIILRVNYLPRQRTEVQIVVAKESMAKKLNEATLIDSKKVKNILGAQLAPLSRVLGGVLIEKLRLVEIDRRKLVGQNNGLLKLLFIIGIGMSFCYAIACAKVCRDTWRKRQAKKDDVMLAEKNKRNYGTCTDKLLSSCEAPNGKVKSKSITSRASVISTSKDRRTSSGDRRSTTRSSKRSNNNNEDLTSITIDINRQDISISQPETSPASGATDSRSFQRMFACDLSQLPAESCDLIDDQDPDAVFFEDGSEIDPATNQTSPKYNNGFAHNYVENVEIHNASMENAPNVNKRPPLPIVPIVIASGSQFSIDKEPAPLEIQVPVVDTKPEYMHQDSTDSVGINQYFDGPAQKSPLLTLIQEDPFKRPLSRRGSRDSPVEQGIEEFEDNESTDSLPLGDKGNESPQNIPTTSKNPEITFEQSSSDESEDETNELYHKLNEEEENEENREKVKNAKSEEKHYSSESDDEQLNENRMLDRHAYERLEESPLPSPSIYTNNNSVGHNKDLLKKKSSEEVVNDLAERVPSDYEEEDLR